jgi:hypothetical protein
MRHDMNLLALMRGVDRYVFLYDDASQEALLEQLDRFASNPELNFTWFDAAVLGEKVRPPTEPASSQAITLPKRF